MKTKHTPGPWRIAAIEGCNYRIEEDVPTARGAIARVIARVMGNNMWSECDARLIAASPKLLTACENMMYVLRQDVADTTYYRAKDEMDTAIKEARGES